jgi:hypothetical protein
MTSSRKQQRPDGPEYRLIITPMFRTREREYRVAVLLETAREFASFRYELTVREEKTDGAIHYRITGLSAPQVSLPGSGPAVFRREYRSLQGPLRISIEGLDHATNVFDLDVSSGHVRLTHSSPNPFVALTIESLVRTDAP